MQITFTHQNAFPYGRWVGVTVLFTREQHDIIARERLGGEEALGGLRGRPISEFEIGIANFLFYTVPLSIIVPFCLVWFFPLSHMYILQYIGGYGMAGIYPLYVFHWRLPRDLNGKEVTLRHLQRGGTHWFWMPTTAEIKLFEHDTREQLDNIKKVLDYSKQAAQSSRYQI